MIGRHTLCSLVIVLVAVVPGVMQASAEQYTLEKAGAPPEELAASVREALAPEGWRVVGPSGPLCEVWIRKVIPAKREASQELGIAFPELAEGTLIGAIRFLAPTGDYRRARVKPGVYTMRHMLYPVDGNHMGVAPQRDFVLLSPAGEDSGAAAMAPSDLLAFSRKASGGGHVSVWRLEATEAAGEPALVHREEENLWVLHCAVTLQPEGGTATKKGLALVVVGAAPEA